MKYNVLDVVIKKRHNQVRHAIRLLYPVQCRDRYWSLFLGRHCVSLGDDPIAWTCMKCMPSKLRVRDAHMFHNQELTIAPLPPDETYLVISRGGPEIKCIAVSHREYR